jgi:predicted enzyme related to lactoylglutathione lyase
MRPHRVWFELIGQHSDTLHDFYSELLGWRDDDSRAPPPRTAAAATSRRIFPRRSTRTPAGPPWWVTFYTCVPDLDSTIRKARSLGSRVLVPPTQHGETVFAVISDPEGHPVGLCS